MNRTLEGLRDEQAAFCTARDWDRFHTPKNLAMALSVEVAELCEHFQWLTPDESAALDRDVRGAVADEIADCLIYLVHLAAKLDIDPLAAAFEKMQKNALKYPLPAGR